MAIILWYWERGRESQREEKEKRLRWEQNKAWLLISLDEVHADFNIELQMVRQHKMSTNALLSVPTSLDPAHVASGTDQGLIEYFDDIQNLVAFADETRRSLPPLQAEYVSWYKYDWCRKYSKLDAAVRNFRQIMAAISLPALALEPVQQLNGILNRAAVAGKDIDAQFDAVITQLRGITL